jgi:STE24 endopeptidase
MLVGTALLLGLFLISAIAELPLGAYGQFRVEARFGFNRQTPAGFAADLLKQSLLGLVIGAPLILLVLWLMGVMGETWWLWVWGVWMAFNLLILAVYPTFIAPLFNKFTPLEDQGLRERIERLLARAGFTSSGVFVMDGSRRSSHGNAYFTGLGRNKRIVFFDTLLSQLDPDQIEAVLAHELGHFKHRHIVKRIGLMFVLSLAMLAVLAWVKEAGWFYAGLGVASPDRRHRPGPVLSGPAGVPVPGHALHEPVFPQARVRGRRLRRQADRAGHLDLRPGAAVSGQRLHPDAGPGVFPFLRQPSQGRGTY